MKLGIAIGISRQNCTAAKISGGFIPEEFSCFNSGIWLMQKKWLMNTKWNFNKVRYGDR